MTEHVSTPSNPSTQGGAAFAAGRHSARWLVVVPLLMALAGCAAARYQGAAPAEIAPERGRLPNIVVIYADDLGYGDVGAYGATGIPTPSLDRLAREGVRFTDAHATAATCTPSRYALLTGEYGFRKNAEILPGDAPALIRPDKFTIADMFKGQGYTTAVIGKWHLGLGDGAVDWNAEVAPGPLEIGFDYSFLLPATADRVPTVYLEGHRAVGLDRDHPLSISYSNRIGARPTGEEQPGLLRQQADSQHSGTIINGISRIGYMEGGESAEWVDEEFHSVFVDKASRFMRENKDRPFFLFFPLTQPHVPRLPAARFAGKTTMGVRGDAIVEMDWMVGQIVAEIERLGLGEDTLVFFSSDNGPVLNDGYEDGAVQMLGAHKPAGPLRGGKYSAFEAGTRVPTLVWWPGRVTAGVSPALMSQVDLLASFAGLLGAPLPSDVAIDSQDHLAAWLGQSQVGRKIAVKESAFGLTLRTGQMKYIQPVARTDGEDFALRKGIESGRSAAPQVYDLAADIGERNNLAVQRPDAVDRMETILQQIRRQTSAANR